jgi:hypothetical protein
MVQRPADMVSLLRFGDSIAYAHSEEATRSCIDSAHNLRAMCSDKKRRLHVLRLLGEDTGRSMDVRIVAAVAVWGVKTSKTAWTVEETQCFLDQLQMLGGGLRVCMELLESAASLDAARSLMLLRAQGGIIKEGCADMRGAISAFRALAGASQMDGCRTAAQTQELCSRGSETYEANRVDSSGAVEARFTKAEKQRWPPAAVDCARDISASERALKLVCGACASLCAELKRMRDQRHDLLSLPGYGEAEALQVLTGELNVPKMSLRTDVEDLALCLPHLLEAEALARAPF